MVKNVLHMRVPSYGIHIIKDAENIQKFKILLKTWDGKPCVCRIVLFAP